MDRLYGIILIKSSDKKCRFGNYYINNSCKERGMRLRQINIVLDLYNGAVCLILFCYLCFEHRQRDRMRRYFLLMCAFNFGMSAGDITNWACEGVMRPWYPAALWAGTLVYWLCSSFMLLSFTAYLMEYLALKARVHLIFLRLSIALCAFHAGGSLLSVWNGMFFTILPENIYQRGSLFWLSQLIPFLMYAVDIAIFVVYRKSLTRKDFRILSSYIVLPIAAEAVQMLNYGLALVNTGVTLGLLIIFVNVQSEQELRLEQQEKALAQQRIDIMISQIQPHFLFNALTAIRQLCEIDPKMAKEVIRDFSLFLRGNMDSLISKTPIPFEQELIHTESYLALEQQRFQSRLRVIYDITARDFFLPPLTLQPIVENAVRHGILHREDGGTVTVCTEENENACLIIVSDDGVGFPAEANNMSGRSHIGISNVRERLSALCGGTLSIQSTPGSGTTVTIYIPKER